jgi:capsid protein
MLSWFGGLFQESTATRRARVRDLRLAAREHRLRQMIRARYDAAQTNADNKNHWMMADGLSARAANSLGVRQTLRNRSRYEASSNSYCAGMLLTLANDMVGTGPRLQLHLPDRQAAAFIEREFGAWARGIKLAQKLRTMRISRARDGEAFGLLTTNPRLETPVQLDLRLIEADQVTSPQLTQSDPLQIDGIKFDTHGNPDQYDILRYHPGDDIAVDNWQPVPHSADQVLHWFRIDRPGQLRGVPEIMPALPLFAQLRRYTLAVIAAAETAADFAAVISSTADPRDSEDGDDDEPSAFTEIEIAARTLLTLPHKYQLQQLKAEQPVTNYGMFKQEILNEIARCLNMPFNVAAGNSAGYNYSSGRLDHQIYFRSIGIDQADCESEILDRLLRAWLDEASLIEGYLPAGLGPFYLWPHTWSWDPAEDLDPAKTASARLTNLAAGMTSYQAEFARLGLDWEVEQSRQAEALGMSLDDYRGLLRQKVLGSIAGAQVAQMQAEQTVSAKLRRRVRRLTQTVSHLRKQLSA